MLCNHVPKLRDNTNSQGSRITEAVRYSFLIFISRATQQRMPRHLSATWHMRVSEMLGGWIRGQAVYIFF